MILLAAGWFTTSLTSLAAQEPPLVLRATTQLVQVEVIVRDRAGRPVKGLARDDFEILEDGRPQELRFFTAYTAEADRRADLPPGMVSNRPEITGPRRGVTVILIDSLNTDWEYKARAMKNLWQFLEGARPEDRVAIYTLGGELKIFHDFTGDARSLRKKLEQHKGSRMDEEGNGLLTSALFGPDTAALMRWAQKVEEEARTVARTEATLDTLEKVANHLGSTPGWKSLIWISSGVPMQVGMVREGTTRGERSVVMGTGERRTFEKEFDRAVRALTNSNVAVYPIDPRGLQELPAYGGTGTAHESNSLLAQLAARTGGRAYLDKNDIVGALKQVTDDAQASYSVAYYPAKAAFDGKYRKIEVRVRRAGLAASHRAGYFALDGAAVPREDGERTLRAAALDPLDAAVIGIDAGLQRKEDGEQVLARIDTAELLWPGKDGFVVQTSVGVFQFDAEGHHLASVVDDIDFTCDAAKAALLSQHGLSYGRKIAVDRRCTRLRLVVRSSRTGAIGSISVPITR